MPPRELERLYDAHAEALFSFLLSLLRDEADTRDALQEVFSRLAKWPDSLNDVRNERGFLLRLSHNLAIDMIRRRSARERAHHALADQVTELFAQTLDPDEATFRRDLANALSELPTDQRVVVHLKLWEGLTFDSIAEALEIPMNTAASRYRYGLDKLQARLRPLYDELR